MTAMFTCLKCKMPLLFQKKIADSWYMYLCKFEDRIYIYHNGGWYAESDKGRKIRIGR